MFMDRNWERAEFLLETARHRPYKIKTTSSSPTGSKWKSIHQKLIELYVDECSKEAKHARLRNASHLLDKLIVREKISCLVVNLYAGNEGYSVMLKGRNGVDTETIRLPYEEAEFLQYIDNEELPPILVDILESSQINIFYSGCVVAEVRDYRRSTSPLIYEAHHVLLRPTMQTLICDVNSITNDGNKWTHDDKMTLESNLLLATQEPLCLEPSVTVTLVANYIQHSRQKFNIKPIKNMAKRYSQTSINRKWKFEQHAAPPDLKLHDFLLNNKDKQKSQLNLRINKNINEIKKQPELKLESPDVIDVLKYAKCLHASEMSFENPLDLVEKYTLESKQGNGKGYYCQLSIFLRSFDDRYVGHLYTDRDYIENVLRGATCRFDLGNRSGVDKYLNQFIEIFIQESRKTVKITHDVKEDGKTVTTVNNVPGGHVICFPYNNNRFQPFDQLQETLHKFSENNIIHPCNGDAPVNNVSIANGSNFQSNTFAKSNIRQAITLQHSSANSAIQVSNHPTNFTLTNKPILPALKSIASSVSSNGQSNIRRSQHSESASTISLLGLSSGITGLINSGDHLTSMGASPAIALPISVALVSPSQSTLITTSSRTIVGESGIISNSTLTVANEVPPTIMVVPGMSPISSVINAPGGVMSFPLAITSNLGAPNNAARFIASNIGPQTHRANSVGLLQVSGSPLINPGNSPQTIQTSTPSPSGVTTPPLGIASVVNVSSGFNQQLHIVHQAGSSINVPVNITSNKSKRKRYDVTSPK